MHRAPPWECESVEPPFGARNHCVLGATPATRVDPGSAQQLKIELRADRQQWCARAIDANGRTPLGTLLAAMTAWAANVSMQTTMSMQSPTSSSTSDNAWAGRFPPNLPTSGQVTIDVFVGGENYETAKAETTVSP
jgi:hypothetical protein